MAAAREAAGSPTGNPSTQHRGSKSSRDRRHDRSRQNLRGPEERDDLEQEARVGVIRGCERFDPQRAVRPSTFLSTAANGQVLHFRRDRANTIRVPWRLRDTYVKGLSCSNNNSRPASHPCRMLSWPTLSTSRLSAGRRPAAASKRNGWCPSAPSMNRHPVQATSSRRNAGFSVPCSC